MSNLIKIVIIGAGAAGLMSAANIGAPVTVLEQNEKAGKKLYITGKGRCNLTNECDSDQFIKHVLSGEKFIVSALKRFSPHFVMDLFDSFGLPLKTERGKRVFPLSDKASDVSKVLINKATRQNSQFIYNIKVKKITALNNGFNIACEDKKEYFADILVVATGGKSYPSTGSDGSMYQLLSNLGHAITPLYPALVPLMVKNDISSLKGIALKNVKLTAKLEDGNACSEGELLFTDCALSGPSILTISAYTSGKNINELSIDLLPALTIQDLNKKLLNLFNLNFNKEIKNILLSLLPKSLCLYIIDDIGLEPLKKANCITKEERLKLATTIKNLTFNVEGTCGFNQAVITSGGVCLKQIDPKTMQSKLFNNLYIIGEVLDIHALTGGYNLQLAWSTALACAESINNQLKNS